MKPVLILLLDRERPPGYLNDFFARQGIATHAVLLAQPADVPSIDWCRRFAGLMVLDAAHQANTLLEVELAVADLLQSAQQRGLAVFAEGRGAQILSRTLRGEFAEQRPVLGWSVVRASDDFNRFSEYGPAPTRMFTWSECACDTPPTAEVLFRNHQQRGIGFVGDGYLAVEFLVSVSRQQYLVWLEQLSTARPAPSGSVQTASELRYAAEHYLKDCHRLAANILRYWSRKIADLKRS